MDHAPVSNRWRLEKVQTTQITLFVRPLALILFIIFLVSLQSTYFFLAITLRAFLYYFFLPQIRKKDAFTFKKFNFPFLPGRVVSNCLFNPDCWVWV